MAIDGVIFGDLSENSLALDEYSEHVVQSAEGWSEITFKMRKRGIIADLLMQYERWST
jgi:hypothetical protein